MASFFPDYVNSLKLTDKNGELLVLNKDGNGSFKDYVKSFVLDSAKKEIEAGMDMTGYSFLNIQNGKIIDLDFESYIKYAGRMKSPGAFDALDCTTGENSLFGDEITDKKYFTEFIYKNRTESYPMADSRIVYMMNAMNYIGKAGATNAKHFRIRHGTKDRDTSLAIPVILATALQNKGIDADLFLPWNLPHSGDYDLPELFEWINNILKEEK